MNEDVASCDTLDRIVERYTESLFVERDERFVSWRQDAQELAEHEVLCGLLGRQVTLASQLAFSPLLWSGHGAPMLLRSMTDVYITFAWIAKEPAVRARQYVEYGLGQAKLQLAHRRAYLERAGKKPDEDPFVQAWERWLNAQLFEFLTIVELGAWSGLDTRRMAQEADCLDLYNFAYVPFSAATHSTWPHISLYNLTECTNPLHGFHRVPEELAVQLDPDYLYRAAKYAHTHQSVI